MKRKRGILVSLLLPAVLLGGCGRGQAEATTISAEKDGSIVQMIREPVSSDLSDMEDIRAYIDEELELYNAALAEGESEISLEQCSEDEETGMISVDLKYPDYEAYQSFNERNFFQGTVAEAQAAGYSLEELRFTDAEGESFSGTQAASDYAEKKILILEEPVTVWTSGRILGVTSQVEIVDNDTATVSSDNGDTEVTSGLNYIIYE